MPRSDSTEKPTEWMEDAFANGGSIAIDCACGRTHFADDERAGDWDKGELERLRAAAKERPDDYLGYEGYDSVRHATINGQVLVIGCPCNGLSKYEGFLWNNRRGIVEYLCKRSEDQKRAADFDAALTGRLQNKVIPL